MEPMLLPLLHLHIAAATASPHCCSCR